MNQESGIKDENYQKLKDYALKLLSFRPRSQKELSGRLMQYSIKKSIPRIVIDKVTTELSEQNLINDEEFASWWVEQRHLFRPKGRRVIELELLQKGIDKEIISKVLSADKNSKENEFQNALKLASKKHSIYKNYSVREMKVKIGNYLLRRGFTWETVDRVIDSLLQKE